MSPLWEILKGDSDPNSSRQLSEAVRQVLSQVEHAIQKQQVHYINYDKPWQACILPTKLTPTVVLWQNSPLMWTQLPVLPVKVLNPYFEALTCLVRKSRMESRRYFGREPNVMNTSYIYKEID